MLRGWIGRDWKWLQAKMWTQGRLPSTTVWMAETVGLPDNAYAMAGRNDVTSYICEERQFWVFWDIQLHGSKQSGLWPVYAATRRCPTLQPSRNDRGRRHRDAAGPCAHRGHPLLLSQETQRREVREGSSSWYQGRCASSKESDIHCQELYWQQPFLPGIHVPL